jgi:hypothetical protein
MRGRAGWSTLRSEFRPMLIARRRQECPFSRTRCGRRTVSGVQGAQFFPIQSLRGYSLTRCMVRASLRRGQFAARRSCSASADQSTGHSMFDCPAAIHTSPTSTSCSTMLLTVSSYGPPASPGFSQTLQRPSSSATSVAVSPRNETVTFSPAFADPQMWTDRPRWTTMWSARMYGRRTSAVAVSTVNRSKAILTAR